MVNKEQKKLLKKYYLSLFNSIISQPINLKKFKKENLGGGYVDSYDDYRYVYPMFKDNDNKITFMVKKSRLRLNLVVKVENDENYELNRWLILYQDWLNLKEQNELKNKLLSIVGIGDNKVMTSYFGDTYIRKLKIDKLKNK